MCHQCGAKGGLAKLATIVGEELSPEIRWDMAIRSISEVPPVEHNFAPLANRYYQEGVNNPNADKRIRDFCSRRGYRVDARHHFWLGWNAGRISFPYWDDDARKAGRCVAIKYRDAHGRKSYEDGSARAVYNVEEIRGAGNVIICEGESDTITAWSHAPEGYRVCGIPGASVSRGQWEIWALDFLFAERILMAFDADEAGDKGASLCREVLGEKVVRLRPDEGLDLSDHFAKHGRLPDVIG